MVVPTVIPLYTVQCISQPMWAKHRLVYKQCIIIIFSERKKILSVFPTPFEEKQFIIQDSRENGKLLKNFYISTFSLSPQLTKNHSKVSFQLYENLQSRDSKIPYVQYSKLCNRTLQSSAKRTSQMFEFLGPYYVISILHLPGVYEFRFEVYFSSIIFSQR